MKVKIGGLCAPFSCSAFQKEVEASLAAVDSCGQSVCIQIFPWEGVDAVTLMLRKEDGGAFPGSPSYGQFKLLRSAYEGHVLFQQEDRQTVALFVKEIEKILSNYRGG